MSTSPDPYSTPGKYSEPRARQIFSQVASAISYMHDMGLIHRDLKVPLPLLSLLPLPLSLLLFLPLQAENVFFTGRDQVVVGDFGFATQLDSQEQQLNTFCGSPPYAAPELFVGKWTDLSIDPRTCSQTL